MMLWVFDRFYFENFTFLYGSFFESLIIYSSPYLFIYFISSKKIWLSSLMASIVQIRLKNASKKSNNAVVMFTIVATYRSVS